MGCHWTIDTRKNPKGPRTLGQFFENALGERVPDEFEVGPETFRPARCLDHDRWARGLDHRAQYLGADLAISEVGMPVRSGSRGITGVVGVQQVDPADYRP